MKNTQISKIRNRKPSGLICTEALKTHCTHEDTAINNKRTERYPVSLGNHQLKLQWHATFCLLG